MQQGKPAGLSQTLRLQLVAVMGLLGLLLLAACASKPVSTVSPLYDPNTVLRLAATPERPEVIILPEANSQHANKARVTLLVGAGALQESDAQLGLAHFVEHMAFRGTEKYPEQQMQERMRELGIQLGRHSNAYTTFDHTAYWLDLNDLSRGQLQAALDILAQWAYDIEFSASAVEEEIPVIVEEWRLTQQDKDRVQPRLIETLFSGSHHLERLPIVGNRPDIEATTAEKLREFYRQWYHPENMAVIVSGDVDAEQTLALIEQSFFRPDILYERRMPTQYDIQPDAIADFTALSDPFTPIAALSLMWFNPIAEFNDARERQAMALEFALGVLRNRLANKQLSSEGVVAGSNLQRNRQSATLRALTMTLVMTEPDFALAYQHLEHELQRLLALGITADEWQTQVSNWQNWLTDLQDSPGRLAGLAKDFWLYQERIVNQRSHKERRLALMDSITPEEALQALAQATAGRAVTVVFHPHGTEAPAAEQLEGYRELARTLPFAPLIENQHPQWQELAPAVAVVTELEHPEGIIEWQLANGITAYYRFSEAVPNRVFVRLTAKHGTNQMPDELVAAARFASGIIRDGGQAGLNSRALQQWRQSLDIRHNFHVDFEERSFYLSAPLSSIEQGLTGLYHRLQHDSLDEELWRFQQAQQLQLWEQLQQHPHLLWHQTRDQLLWQDDIRYRELTKADIEAISLPQAQAFYEQWIQGNQGYQLALVGDLTAEQARTLVERFFASLPAAQPQGEGRLSPQPQQPMQARVSGSGEQHARISLRYYLDKTQLPQAWQATPTTLLTNWLDEQLFDRIRTQSGLTYSIRAEVTGVSPAHALFSLHISLQTDPEKVDEAIAEVQRLLTEVATQPPTEQQVAVWHQSLADERLQLRQRPSWLVNRIGYSEVMDSVPWRRIAPLGEPPTADNLQQLLVQVVEQGHLVELVWLP